MSDLPESDGIEEPEIMTYIARPEDHGARLDKVLAARFSDLSRSRLKALIINGDVALDDASCTDPSRKVKEGMVLAVAVPPPVDDTPLPENIPLDILYEDDALLVINKQAGLVVHPGAGNPNGTLVNALLYHCGQSLSGIGGVRRPGIVHRLDKDTSGLMVAAKTDKAHQGLSAQLSDRTLGRHYKALVWGAPVPAKGFIDQPIGRHPSNRLKMAVNRKNGREAGTHYKVEERLGEAVSQVDCKLDSGRTHQVRVHMAYIRCPLLGDPLYGQPRNAGEAALKRAGYEPDQIAAILSFPRQALHAWKMSFVHPVSGQRMDWEAALPDDLVKLKKLLISKS